MNARMNECKIELWYPILITIFLIQNKRLSQNIRITSVIFFVIYAVAQLQTLPY